jgi:hypothetical protein
MRRTCTYAAMKLDERRRSRWAFFNSLLIPLIDIHESPSYTYNQMRVLRPAIMIFYR